MGSKSIQILFLMIATLVLTNCSAQKFDPASALPDDQAASDPTVPPVPTTLPPVDPTPTTLPPAPTPTTLPPAPTPTTLPPAPTPTTLPPAPTPTTLPPVVPPSGKSDTFIQDTGANQIDILVIDDNSPSMDSLEAKLGPRFSSFVSSLGDINYHIGITTTDVSSDQYGVKGSLLPLVGASGNYISPNTPNANSVFMNTIKRPEAGCFIFNCASSDEQALGASVMAMQKSETNNAGFFRQDTDLAIVILTDEDEKSTGSGTKPQDVINAFKAKWGNTKHLRVYALIVQPGDSVCAAQRRTFEDNPLVYSTFADKLVKLTGGVEGSVCASDYSASLTSISQNVRQLVNSFTLSSMPVASSVQVKLTPAPAVAISYQVVGNQIVFSSAPPAGTRIDVSYDPQ